MELGVNMHSQSQVGKLHIKRHEPYILVNKLFHYFPTNDYDVIVNFHVDSTTSTSFKKLNVMLP